MAPPKPSRYRRSEDLRILHVITGLNLGGAETGLFRLAVADPEDSHTVISLTDEGTYGEALVAAGVPVHALGLSRRLPKPRALTRLFALVRAIDPDVVQTWMYHSDMLGGTVARLAGKKAIVWGIQNSTFDRATTPAARRLVARMCALVSRVVPARIVSVSHAGARIHLEAGYSRKKMTVIPNGYDVSRFAPSDLDRDRLRSEHGVPTETALLGMVARWDPQKDHATLLAALTRLNELDRSWHCWLVGTDMTHTNLALARMLERSGVQRRVSLLGPRSDMPAVMNALDIHLLSSFTEGFPNVVAEAMACGTPCVVTDVGDSAWIVGDTGAVVPARDPARLAEAVAKMIGQSRDNDAWRMRREAARDRIAANFGMDRMVRRYREVWALALQGSDGTASHRRADRS